MKPHFAFKFANSSTALKNIHTVRYQEGQSGKHKRCANQQGKPIHAFFTQGMQVVGVPQELIQIVGRTAIASLNGGVNFGDVGKPIDDSLAKGNGNRLITSVHMETDDAIYLMRIENQIYMAMPD